MTGIPAVRAEEPLALAGAPSTAPVTAPGHLHDLMGDSPVPVAPDPAFSVPFHSALFDLSGAAASSPMVGVVRVLAEHHHVSARRMGHDGEMARGVQVDPDPVAGRGIPWRDRIDVNLHLREY